MRYKMRCRFAAILKNMLIGLCLNDKWEFVGELGIDSLRRGRVSRPFA